MRGLGQDIYTRCSPITFFSYSCSVYCNTQTTEKKCAVGALDMHQHMDDQVGLVYQTTIALRQRAARLCCMVTAACSQSHLVWASSAHNTQAAAKWHGLCLLHAHAGTSVPPSSAGCRPTASPPHTIPPLLDKMGPTTTHLGLI